MNKPDYVSQPDWEILLNKYSENIEELEVKIKEQYPVQYLIGNVDFLGNVIEVNENVLIPRFETELLVEKIIKRNKLANPKILDIGTGSGCIAISLAKAIPAQVSALDICDKALKVAKNNAKKNNVAISFYKSDILNDSIESMYDMIVSNPPYVKDDEEVDPQTKYEPQKALFAKNNGIEFYEAIIKKSVGHINKIGLIAFEIGCTQGEDIKNIAKQYYPHAEVTIEKDYTNRDRFVFIEIKE